MDRDDLHRRLSNEFMRRRHSLVGGYAEPSKRGAHLQATHRHKEEDKEQASEAPQERPDLSATNSAASE